MLTNTEMFTVKIVGHPLLNNVQLLISIVGVLNCHHRNFDNRRLYTLISLLEREIHPSSAQLDDRFPAKHTQQKIIFIHDVIRFTYFSVQDEINKNQIRTRFE